jgi:arylsulfatase A-like enzyme
MHALLAPLRRSAEAASLFLVAVTAPLLAAGAAAQPGPRPNVVVITADDLGYGDLGSYGSPDARTPHLDALATRGLRFTDFYAGGPVCTPSRYALLTGLHAFRANDRRLLDALKPEDTRSGVNDRDTETLGEALQAEGYEAAMIGKWHLGHGQMLTGNAGNTEFHPSKHGFDSFFGVLGGAIDYNTHEFLGGYLDWWEDRRRRPEDHGRYATLEFGSRAVAFLDDHAGAGSSEPPFFLYLPFTAPHAGVSTQPGPVAKLQLPIGREREYLSRFDHLYPDDENVRKRYLAMVAVLDDEVGRIVDALQRNGLMANTVVWFISDNGGQNGLGSNGPLRGGKRSPYEGGIRVPSFVVWEGHVAPGTAGQIAGNVDVLPTVLALAGASAPATDGLDLSAFLLGGPPVERGIAVPNTVIGDAYRLGAWKYVQRYRSNGNPYPAELYDLAADPGETTNVAGAHPDVVASLASQMPYGTQPRGQAASPTLLAAPLAAEVLPNPFARRTTIRFTLDASMAVRLAVYDVLGREVAVLVDGEREAGTHAATLDGRGLAPGVYVYRLTAGGEVQTGPMTLAR